MLSDIPKLIERLKKYLRFRKSHKVNQCAAWDNWLVSQKAFSALASQLFSSNPFGQREDMTFKKTG